MAGFIMSGVNMILPQIVYLQTTTRCNGHCRYCPFDDVYGDKEPVDMCESKYVEILEWLKANNYNGRISFYLHHEPTLEERMEIFIDYAREILPGIRLEAITNGLLKPDWLKKLNVIDVIPAGSKTASTSRAGNVRACPEIEGRGILREAPCPIPLETMCIAANGDVLLCCQDWRHEAVVGTLDNLDKARNEQIKVWQKAKDLKLEICQDCMAGKTAEEVGERLGKRFINQPKKKRKKLNERSNNSDIQ